MAYRIRRTIKNIVTIPFAIIIRLPVAFAAAVLYQLATYADDAARFIDYKVLPYTPYIEFENTDSEAERKAVIDRLHG